MPMQTWSDFERKQSLVEKRKLEMQMDCVNCPQCGGQWFEEVILYRFKADHNLVLGQEVPPRPGSVGYRFMRCALCSNLLEPRVMHNVRDLAAGDYDNLLDTMEGKFDKRKKVEEEKSSAVKAEEL